MTTPTPFLNARVACDLGEMLRQRLVCREPGGRHESIGVVLVKVLHSVSLSRSDAAVVKFRADCMIKHWARVCVVLQKGSEYE